MTLEEYINQNYSSVLARLQFERYQASLPLNEVFIPGNKFWPISAGYGGFGCNGQLLTLIPQDKKEKINWSKCHIVKEYVDDYNNLGSVVDERDWFRKVALCPDFVLKDEKQIRLWKSFLVLIYKDQTSVLQGYHRFENSPYDWMNIRARV